MELTLPERCIVEKGINYIINTTFEWPGLTFPQSIKNIENA